MVEATLVAGGLLAFALFLDEVIVTAFTAGAQNTLPLWIIGNIRLGGSLLQVSVVALFVIVLTIVPVWFAQVARTVVVNSVSRRSEMTFSPYPSQLTPSLLLRSQRVNKRGSLARLRAMREAAHGWTASRCCWLWLWLE